MYCEDGQMKLDGKPFYGLGVNYYSLFNYAFTHQWDTSVQCAALSTHCGAMRNPPQMCCPSSCREAM